MPHRTDGSTVVRLTREQIARPKKAFDALLGSRNLNFLLAPDGRIGIDRRVRDLVGSDALAQLLLAHIHAINRSGPRVPPHLTTPVNDREVVEAALWALTAVLEEAARLVADDPKG